MSRHIPQDFVNLRNSLGLTQGEMAERMDMSARALQDIEAGKSAYRWVHRAAAERVALQLAVDKKNPMLAPAEVRRDALELARLITG